MRELTENRSTCNVKLLAIASQATYKVKKNDTIDSTYSDAYKQTLDDIAKQGYAITQAISPIKKSQGTGTTPLAALCLTPQNPTPQDPKSPIIIAFRGTKTRGDVVSDLRLGLLGVVDKIFRDDAFNFYQKIRDQHPEREIILTGHSLGGHLAQYVATKAYNTDEKLLANPIVQVRTFNTAPVSTIHSSVFKTHPHILPQFVNYRLSSDVVSDLPVQHYYGNTFVSPCSKGAFSSHSMGSVLKFLPSEILNQTVGTSERSKEHNMLAELITGVMSSYQCRIAGQYFSRFRAGAKNLKEMQTILPKVAQDINNSNYNEAIQQLVDLKTRLDGKVSTKFIHALIERARTVNAKESSLHKSGIDSLAQSTEGDPLIMRQREMKDKVRVMKDASTETASKDKGDEDEQSTQLGM